MAKTFQWKARYTILLILCIGSIVSFMDRVAMPVAIPYIAADLHLSALASGLVMSVFSITYSFSQIPGGLLSDVFGVRKVSTIALLWWSAFTGLTGAAVALPQMLIARLLFGLGEGLFPACLFKSIAVWFPKKERATANAIRLASSPLGAAIAPLAVVGIMSLWGWRTVFYALFLPGVLTALLFWVFILDKPSESSSVSPEELAEIEEGGDADNKNVGTKVGFLQAFKEPNVLKYCLVLFSSSIAYWGFTSWLPTYLVKARGFSMAQMGAAASLPFVAGIVGSILGGWVSERYFNSNRRIPVVAAQVISAILLYLLFTTSSVTTLVIYQTLAGLFLHFIITSVWALPMATVSKNLMGVASGFINMGAQIAALISPIVVGYLVGASGGNYDHAFMFLIASLLVSCAIVFTLPGKSQQLQDAAVRG